MVGKGMQAWYGRATPPACSQATLSVPSKTQRGEEPANLTQPVLCFAVYIS